MVKIYSTPTCPWCKKVKAYLEEKSIKYENLNVAEDMKAQEEMIKISGQMGVPVIDIEGKIVVGFEKTRIDELLKIQP